MTKLALYEKNRGKDDFKVMEYYKNDYVSYNNFMMQLSVTIGLVLVFAMQFAQIVMDNLTTITEYNFVNLGAKYLTIWLIFMVIYTVVSTVQNRVIYAKAKRRTDAYEKMLKKLDKIQ